MGALTKLANLPYSFFGTHSITAKSAKYWNNLQKKVIFEFNQKRVSTLKLISTLKKYF